MSPGANFVRALQFGQAQTAVSVACNTTGSRRASLAAGRPCDAGTHALHVGRRPTNLRSRTRRKIPGVNLSSSRSPGSTSRSVAHRRSNSVWRPILAMPGSLTFHPRPSPRRSSIRHLPISKRACTSTFRNGSEPSTGRSAATTEELDFLVRSIPGKGRTKPTKKRGLTP